MQLSDARTGDVVRNLNNSNYYRYERPEEGRARIRPLELFPNGLLIAKPTDTIVDQAIVVQVIGQWSEGMVVSRGKSKSRAVYQKEREQLQAQLDVLEAEALVIEPKMRGSHGMRVKAVRARLEVLGRGLEDIGTEPVSVDTQQLSLVPFKLRQSVIMPSGQPATFLGLLPVGQQLLATVATKVGNSLCVLQIMPEALKMAECRHMATA